MASVKAKTSNYGFVEITQESGMYILYVNGSIQAQSSNLDYILREFDKW